jgi:hypothetical protein
MNSARGIDRDGLTLRATQPLETPKPWEMYTGVKLMARNRPHFNAYE